LRALSLSWRWIRRLGRAAALTVLALLVLEGGLWLVYGRTFSRWRARSLRPAPRDGVTRIVSYGDSIVGGYGIDEKAAYSPVLASLLDENEPGVPHQVQIAGGYCPSKYAERLRADLDARRPTAVLVEIELSNDVSDEALLRWDAADERGLPTRLAGGRYVHAWDGTLLATTATSDRFYEHTRLYTLLARAVGWARERTHPNPAFADGADTYYYNLGFDRSRLTAERLEQGFEQLFRALAAMNALCRERGVRFVLLVLPSQYWFDAGPFHAGALRLLERAKAQARALGIEVVSPTEELAAAGGANAFMDFCHPTAAGHLAIAHALARALGRPRAGSSVVGRAIARARLGE